MAYDSDDGAFLLDPSMRSVQNEAPMSMDYGSLYDSSNLDEEIEVTVDDSKSRPRWWSINPLTLWRYTGPGFLVCIAYIDPGNLESDLQAGALAGYDLAWVLIVATVVGLTFQLMSLRLGLVTGKSLAELARLNYSKPVSVVLWLLVELAIIGADIQEVVGSAIAIKILSLGYVPLWLGCILTCTDAITYLILDWIPYGSRITELIFGGLVFVMVISFAAEFASADPNIPKLLEGMVVPRLTTKTIIPAVGILGATVMPHNLYLHSAIVLDRPLDRKDRIAVREAFKYHAIEASAALCISLFINLLILGLAASTFGGERNVGLATAGDILSRNFGEVARYIWAIGLLSAGQSSNMTCTVVGQFVLKGYLNFRMPVWIRVLITRVLSILPAVIVALMAEEYMDDLNQLINLVESAILPAAIIPTIDFVTDASVVGRFYLIPWRFCVIFLGISGSIFILVTNGFLVIVQGYESDAPHLYLPIIGVALVIYVSASFLLSIRRFYRPAFNLVFKSKK